VVHLARVEQYLAATQARREGDDDRKRRYDFLRSEYAVGALLAKVRQRLGRGPSWEMTRTLATRTPATLAGLLEGYVADAAAAGDLDRVQRVYAAVAEFSQGILVTPEQAALFADPAFARAHAIDVDRDGAVPAGTPANSARPAAFPAEPDPLPGVADPLAWDSQGSTLFAAEGQAGPAEAFHTEAPAASRDHGDAVCTSCTPRGPAQPSFEDLR
jgi:hypothetical protein